MRFFILPSDGPDLQLQNNRPFENGKMISFQGQFHILSALSIENPNQDGIYVAFMLHLYCNSQHQKGFIEPAVQPLKEIVSIIDSLGRDYTSLPAYFKLNSHLFSRKSSFSGGIPPREMNPHNSVTSPEIDLK